MRFVNTNILGYFHADIAKVLREEGKMFMGAFEILQDRPSRVLRFLAAKRIKFYCLKPQNHEKNYVSLSHSAIANPITLTHFLIWQPLHQFFSRCSAIFVFPRLLAYSSGVPQVTT
jgi:hypothetical protein